MSIKIETALLSENGSITGNSNSLGNSLNYIVTDGCIFKSKRLDCLGSFFIISAESLGRRRFFVLKMVTSLPEDFFCLWYAFLELNIVRSHRFGNLAWSVLAGLAMFVLAACWPISALFSGEYFEYLVRPKNSC